MEHEQFDIEVGLMMDEAEEEIRWWYPCQALRNTNWLHRTDALRVRDLRTLQMLWFQAQSFMEMAVLPMLVRSWIGADLVECSQSVCDWTKVCVISSILIPFFCRARWIGWERRLGLLLVRSCCEVQVPEEL